MELVTFYSMISLVYMQKENAAVVTSYSKLHDGCVSLCTENIPNTKTALHNGIMLSVHVTGRQKHLKYSLGTKSILHM